MSKEKIKELKNRLSHAEKSRDDNYERYSKERVKNQELEAKLAEAMNIRQEFRHQKQESEYNEVYRLKEIIRWLINKETAVIPPPTFDKYGNIIH